MSVYIALNRRLLFIISYNNYFIFNSYGFILILFMNIVIPYLTYKPLLRLDNKYSLNDIDIIYIIKDVFMITLIRGILSSFLIFGYNSYILVPVNIIAAIYFYKQKNINYDVMWDLNIYFLLCLYLSQAF